MASKHTFKTITTQFLSALNYVHLLTLQEFGCKSLLNFNWYTMKFHDCNNPNALKQICKWLSKLYSKICYFRCGSYSVKCPPLSRCAKSIYHRIIKSDSVVILTTTSKPIYLRIYTPATHSIDHAVHLAQGQRRYF